MQKTSEDAEARFSINAEFLKTLQRRLGSDRATDVARAALTLLDWASREASDGRIILSSTSDGV